MSVVTDSEKVKKAQDGVLEFLLANHPLDCPVCDKGGECPLQDQTLAHGSGETPLHRGEAPLRQAHRDRRARPARPRALHPVRALHALRRRGRRRRRRSTSPGAASSSRWRRRRPSRSTRIFSGNTVQICPVGALTAKPYRFTARPWDLEQVESTCTTCAVGCRVAVQSSANRLTRVLGVDSDPVNHGWLCDKGRFALESIDGHERRGRPPESPRRASPSRSCDATATLRRRRAGARRSPRPRPLLLDAAATPDGVGAIGGAALTNEGAFAWERLHARRRGHRHLDAQYGDGLDGALLAGAAARDDRRRGAARASWSR